MKPPVRPHHRHSINHLIRSMQTAWGKPHPYRRRCRASHAHAPSHHRRTALLKQQRRLENLRPAVHTSTMVKTMLNRLARYNKWFGLLWRVHDPKDFPVLQYVDDTSVIMEADAPQVHCLKGLLNTFASSMGLRVDYNSPFHIFGSTSGNNKT